MTRVEFFGDSDHKFALPFPLIEELQRKTGVAIGVLYQRMHALSFSVTDIRETIRLGLIGGGMLPVIADALVKTYVENRPLAETIPVALSILELVWFGSPTASQDEIGQPDRHLQEAAATGNLAAAVSEADHG